MGPLNAMNLPGTIHEMSPFSKATRRRNVGNEKSLKLKCPRERTRCNALAQSSTVNANVLIAKAASRNGKNGGSMPMNGPYASSTGCSSTRMRYERSKTAALERRWGWLEVCTTTLFRAVAAARRASCSCVQNV